MNILEAIKAVEDGKYIRYEDGLENVFFVLESTLIPMNIKSIIQIDLDDIDRMKTYPKDLSGIDYNEVNQVCLSSIRSDEFTEVSYEEMMSEIQEKFKQSREDS
jgi:hypothetical protein